jgi:hypothetical protein
MDSNSGCEGREGQKCAVRISFSLRHAEIGGSVVGQRPWIKMMLQSTRPVTKRRLRAAYQNPLL